jgi:glycosyltransferase involved in cell wall biosynthesis
MKVLKSCGSPSWGGIEIYILRTIEALNQHSDDVPILCLPDSNIQKNARENGITILPILSKGAGRLGSILKLKKYLKENNTDVIHTHLSNDLWILVPALKLAGSKAKLILSKGMESGVNKKDIFHRLLYDRVDCVVPVSDFIKKNVIATCPVGEDKMKVIHDGIQLEKFNPDLFNKNEIRKQLGFNESTIIIGMVGRMSPGKGHEIFFRSAKMIIDSGLKDRVNFLVVGSASFGEVEYEKKLHTEAESLGLKEVITFAGHQSNIPYYLSAIDILAFPSNDESFGGTLLEAMAMKLPVAASNSGAVPEIVIDGETGLLVPRNDAAALTEAFIKLIKDEKLRSTLGANGRKRAEQHFDMKEYIRKFEELYGG